MRDVDTFRTGIKEYYGKILQNSRDLKTNACCTIDSIPEKYRAILSEIPSEIMERFYGCGSPIPLDATGCVVLDLGCGSGRDAYIVSKLVGAKGRVIGVDMTREQLEVASKHVDSQMEKWAYSTANLEFRLGYIEDLSSISIEDNSIDIVISNCVLNLSPDKERLFKEIFRVLKPGGELFFSDVFAGRRVPAHLQADPVLRGECLGGALYWEDFRRLMQRAGFQDHRVVFKRKMDLGNSEIENRIGMVDFYSSTVRAFKIQELEDICEDYGQAATYLGSLSDSPHTFVLDDHHIFITGKPMLICGNTAAMLSKTRYAKHFRITGDTSTHFGPFECGTSSPGNSIGGLGSLCC